MEPDAGNSAIDRHALVMALWLAFGFLAAASLHYGFGAGGWRWIAASCSAVLAAFIGHIIVNTVYQTTFTRRELALFLVVYFAMLLAYSLALLLRPGFKEAHALPLGLGLGAIGIGVMSYMIIHFGMRGVFDAFNVIGDFRPEGDAGSRTAQRRGGP